FPFDDTVTVHVGPDNERFSIHKRLVCQFPFFEAAFNGNFQESAAGILKLPEHDPAIFRFFVYWLYTGKLDGHHYPSTAKPSLSDIRKECKLEQHEKHLPHLTAKSDKRLTSGQFQLYTLIAYRDAPFDVMIGLYLLAEYLQVPVLRDEVVNVLVDVYAYCGEEFDGVSTSFWRWRNYSRPHWAPDPVPAINAAWKSSKDSKLCRLLVTLFCDNVILCAEEVQENERLDAAFLSAAFTTAQERWLRGSTRTKWSQPDSLCPYHIHESNTCKVHNEKIAKAEK
ncbi:MAG: hypothetical protein L6R38_000532, partial [Xanthoria sp. 2 TBL-2021]